MDEGPHELRTRLDVLVPLLHLGGHPRRKVRPRCTPKEVELELKVKDVVPKERFSTAQNLGWQE